MILPETVLFPGASLPLHVTQPPYLKMIKDVLEGERVLIVACKNVRTGRACRVSGVGLLRAATQNEGQYLVVIEGLGRILLERRLVSRPYPIYQVAPISQPTLSPSVLRPLVKELREKITWIVRKMETLPPQYISDLWLDASKTPTAYLRGFLKFLLKIKDPGILADIVGCTLVPPGEGRQILLNLCDVSYRLQTLIDILCKTYHPPK